MTLPPLFFPRLPHTPGEGAARNSLGPETDTQVGTGAQKSGAFAAPLQITLGRDFEKSLSLSARLLFDPPGEVPIIKVRGTFLKSKKAKHARL